MNLNHFEPLLMRGPCVVREISQIALKVLDKTKLTEQRKIWLEEELYLLQKLHHENIIKMQGWFEDGPAFFILFEYAEHLDIIQVRANRYLS